jgi:hypothetical protein
MGNVKIVHITQEELDMMVMEKAVLQINVN